MYFLTCSLSKHGDNPPPPPSLSSPKTYYFFGFTERHKSSRTFLMHSLMKGLRGQIWPLINHVSPSFSPSSIMIHTYLTYYAYIKVNQYGYFFSTVRARTFCAIKLSTGIRIDTVCYKRYLYYIKHGTVCDRFCWLYDKLT